MNGDVNQAITEILARHHQVSRLRCRCGWVGSVLSPPFELIWHHQTQMLTPLLAEQRRNAAIEALDQR